MKVEKSAGSKKVLVIESDRTLSYVLRNKLAAAGYETHYAHTGEIALTLIGKNNYNLILLDLLLAGSDGFNLLEKISINKGTKIVALSSLEQTEDKERAERLGLSAFMPKSSTSIPFLVRELDKLLRA